MTSKNSNSHERDNTGLLTPWYTRLMAWIIIMAMVAGIVIFGVVLPFDPVKITAVILLAHGILYFMYSNKSKWYARESLAQRAVALLKMTPEGQTYSVSPIMKKALRDKNFLRELRQSLTTSRWIINQENHTLGRWEVTFPATWKNTNWNWCAFGLLSAARPQDLVCINATRVDQKIVMDLAGAPEVLPAMLRWGRELSRALGVMDHQSIIKVEPFEVLGIENTSKKAEKTPWVEIVILEPEDVTLILTYADGVYTATTKKDGLSQTSEYKSWMSLWETWHYFDDADEVLIKHKDID